VELGYRLGMVRSDNGTEFVNEKLKNYAKGNFILRTTPPHCPQVIVYVNNRVIHKDVRSSTSFELLFGRKPNVSNLRVFGCKAYSKEVRR
jgi:hypothetical protein